MQQARKLDLLLRSKSDDEDSDPDQFSPSVLSGLAARISFIQEQNVKKSSNLSRNWREGYWTVRGFAITTDEPDDPMDSVVTDAEEGYKKMKEKVAKRGSNEEVEDVLPPTITSVLLMEGQSSIAVGRSDGLVFTVKVGTETYASFVKKPTLILNPSGSVSTRTDFVREEDLMPPIEGDELEPAGPPAAEETKFDILTHCSLWPGGIVAMTCLDETTFAVATSTPSIHILSTSTKNPPITVPTPNLKPVGLSTLSTECFVVAYSDGTVQTIKRRGTTSSYFPRHTTTIPTKYPLTSLATTPTLVYVGNTEGEIFIAKVEQLDLKLEPIVSATFKPFQSSPVTALHAVVGGTLSSKVREAANGSEGEDSIEVFADGEDNDTSTTVLLAGSEAGEVKQYEILPTQGGNFTHWPRLKNQKLKKRAHVFLGNYDKIIKITGDHSKIITACEDGSIRFYNPRDGKECTYMMDGLDGITQMSLGEDVLVTNGMEEGFVCLHDFGIIEDTLDFGKFEVE